MLFELVAPEGPMYQAGTLSGHPLAMAAGIATLDQLTPDAYLRAGGHRLRSLAAGLEKAAETAGITVSISRVGSLLTVFFNDTLPTDAAEALASDRDAFGRFFRGMLRRGVFLPPSPFEAWFLSLAHGEAEVAAILEAARGAFGDVAGAA